MKKLAELEGHSIKRSHIPDYIDPKFAKEKQIYDDDDDEEIGNKKTDDMIGKKVKNRSPKGKEKKDKKDKRNKSKKDKNNDKKKKKKK